MKGPVFANIVLADEINRTPPKTQAALLAGDAGIPGDGRRADVSAGAAVLRAGDAEPDRAGRDLSAARSPARPVHVHGEHRLSEPKEERQIVRATTMDLDGEPEPVLSAADILHVQKVLRKLPVSDHVVDYAVSLARATRPKEPNTPQFINEWLTWGAGPRAAQYLVLGAKARAILNGRLNVSCDDVRAVAKPVLRHRLFTNFNADAEGIGPDQVVEKLPRATRIRLSSRCIERLESPNIAFAMIDPLCRVIDPTHEHAGKSLPMPVLPLLRSEGARPVAPRSWSATPVARSHRWTKRAVQLARGAGPRAPWRDHSP